MSLYKRKNSPFWQYDFQFRGCRFHGSTGCSSKAEAAKFEAREREKAKRQAKDRSGAKMTVDAAVGRYWVEIAQHFKQADKIEHQLAWIVDHFKPSTRLSEIGDSEVARAVAKRRGETRRNAPKASNALVSKSTVNRTVLAPLRQIMHRAKKVWKVPVQEIEWGEHWLDEPGHRTRVLKRGQEEAALLEALKPQYHPLVLFFTVMGMRANEAIGMEWNHIDWGERRLMVYGKGGTEIWLPLPALIRDLLWSLQGRHSIKVWAYDNGEPITYWGFQSAFRRARERAEITDLRIHDLRHTAATRLLGKSGNLKIVQLLLRHRSISSTMRYAHAFNKDLLNALESPDTIPDTRKDVSEDIEIKRDKKAAR